MAAGGVSDYQVNILNMAKYVDSFQDRDDVSDKLKGGLKIDTLLVTGSKQSSLKACEAMFSNCNKVYMNITCNILVNFNKKHHAITIASYWLFHFRQGRRLSNMKM